MVDFEDYEAAVFQLQFCHALLSHVMIFFFFIFEIPTGLFVCG